MGLLSIFPLVLVAQDVKIGGQVNHRRLSSFLPSTVAEISGTINRFNHLSSLSLSSGEISRAGERRVRDAAAAAAHSHGKIRDD